VIYYLDTSALVKRYYVEKGSAWVHSLFRPDNLLVVSKVAYAEFLAALARCHPSLHSSMVPKTDQSRDHLCVF